MFSCCSLCNIKYLDDKPGYPVNEDAYKQATTKEPIPLEQICKCVCHIIGWETYH